MPQVMMFKCVREIESQYFACLCVSEIHRDFLHRPPSGYLPEEIWRKAGKCKVLFIFFLSVLTD